MNILTFQGEGRILPHTQQDVREALVRLGHRVELLALASHPPYVRMVLFAQALVRFRPDVIFTIDADGLLPLLTAVLPKPPPVIAWFYDDPLALLQEAHQTIRHVLHIFLWDRSYEEPVRRLGFRHVHYQPFGTHFAHHQERRHQGDYLYDVSFVGAHSPGREQRLLALAERGIRIHVFGNDAWAAAARGNLVYAGWADNREDCPRIYSASKINLNITSEQLRTALPVRVFDVLASGGFLLTDRRRDAEELFAPGREIVVYDDVEDLAAKIGHYLARDDERRAVAEAGMRRVEAAYSFDTLLPPMIRKVFDTAPESAPELVWNPTTLRVSWLVCMSALQVRDMALADTLVERLRAHAPGEEMTRVASDLMTALLRRNAPEPDWAAIYERFFAGLG